MYFIFNFENGITVGNLVINENNLIESMTILKNFNIEGTIEYRNSKNARNFKRTKEIFLHLINHSTYHRGAASALMKEAGIDLPPLDYIYFE